jgi:cytoskeletal protein RodZ
VDDLSELAQVLRKARQDKGISLAEIQETTKIQRRYLEAIENGNFEVLPGHFYVRAFIKSYAEAVGLDAEELITQYSSELPEPPKVEEAPPPLRQNRQGHKEKDGNSSKWVSRILLYLFAILVLAVIIAGIKYAVKGKEEQPTPPPAAKKEQPSSDKKADIFVPPPDTSETKPQQPAAQPAQQPPAATGKVTPAPKTGSTMNFDLTGADKITVKVTAKTGDHWMSISGTQGQIAQQTLKEGQSQTFEVPQDKGAEVLLRIVRARDVEVLVNGQPIDTAEAKKSGTQRIKIVRK